MIPEHCSFVAEGTKCPLPPEFIIEVEDEIDDSKFMIGLTCSDHRAVLENKFHLLQKNNVIPSGKIRLTNIKIIHTDCIKGNQEDEEEVRSKRINI